MDVSFICTETWSNLLSAVIVTASIVLLIFYNTQTHNINFPPGPKGYPIIGNILDIPPDKILGTFRRWRLTYGDLFTIHLGTQLAVIVNGYENLKELFSKNGDVVSDRPPIFFFKDLFQQSGIISSSGNLWKEHRSFALKSLRGFAFGKQRIESNIMEEVDIFLREIEKYDGKSFCVDELLNMCISNIISFIAFGQRFDFSDKRFKAILLLMEDIFKSTSVNGPVTIFPFLKYLPGDPFAAKRLLRDARSLKGFVQDIIDEHKSTYNPNNIRDYIDVYLKEKIERIGSEKNTFTDEQLTATVTDLFLAGTETTTTIIKWFVLYMLNYPNVQVKMAKEIEVTIGTSRLPSLNDKAHLPFCEAVMTEVMRCANITPLASMHLAKDNVQMHGFNIPKNCILFPNLDSVMKDPAIFANPDKFKPERFIDNNGRFGGYDKVIPFSIGRRVCLGETLARAELFLFSTSMVQRFKLLPLEGKPVPPLYGRFGATYVPNSFDFLPVKRYNI